MFNQLEKLPGEMQDMLSSILYGLPCTLACQLSPSACNTFKQIQNIANLNLRSIRRNCQEIMSRSMAMGVSMRDDAQGLCFREGLQSGCDPESLWEACLGNPPLVPGPNGVKGQTIHVIETILETTGMPAEQAERVRQTFGDIVVTTGIGGLRVSSQSKRNYPLLRYQKLLEAFTIEIARAVSVAQAGRVPPGIAVGGHALPYDVVKNIALEPHAQVRVAQIQRLASSLAMSATIWDLITAQEALESALAASDLPVSQRRVVMRQLEANARNIARLEKRKTIIENHVGPVVSDNLREYAVRLSTAASITTEITTQAEMPRRYESGANPFGYVQ